MPKKSTKTNPRAAAEKKQRASERGVPQVLVDALIEVLGVDEDEITVQAQLEDDLGADEMDLAELAIVLEEACQLSPHALSDEALDDWKLVADAIHGLKQAGVKF